MERLRVVILAFSLSACGAPPSQSAVKDAPKTPVALEAPISEPAPQAAAVAQPPIFPTEEIQARWKIELESLCAGNDASIPRAAFDITGDGKPEQICWRVVKGPPNGEYLDLVVAHDGGTRRQSAYVLLPVNGGIQEAVCPGGPYTVTPEDWTDAHKREFMEIPADWPKLGLTVHGGQCDPVHLFWPGDAETFDDTGVLFYFARL